MDKAKNNVVVSVQKDQLCKPTTKCVVDEEMDNESIRNSHCNICSKDQVSAFIDVGKNNDSPTDGCFVNGCIGDIQIGSASISQRCGYIESHVLSMAVLEMFELAMVLIHKDVVVANHVMMILLIILMVIKVMVLLVMVALLMAV